VQQRERERAAFAAPRAARIARGLARALLPSASGAELQPVRAPLSTACS